MLVRNRVASVESNNIGSLVNSVPYRRILNKRFSPHITFEGADGVICNNIHFKLPTLTVKENMVL